MVEEISSTEIIPNASPKSVFLDCIFVYKNYNYQKDSCNFFEEPPYIFILKITSVEEEKK